MHSGVWQSQHFINQIIEYSAGEAAEMENAATDVSKAEELDVAEKGRGLTSTKAELAEFALMRTRGNILYKMLRHCSQIKGQRGWQHTNGGRSP